MTTKRPTAESIVNKLLETRFEPNDYRLPYMAYKYGHFTRCGGCHKMYDTDTAEKTERDLPNTLTGLKSGEILTTCPHCGFVEAPFDALRTDEDPLAEL